MRVEAGSLDLRKRVVEAKPQPIDGAALESGVRRQQSYNGGTGGWWKAVLIMNTKQQY